MKNYQYIIRETDRTGINSLNKIRGKKEFYNLQNKYWTRTSGSQWLGRKEYVREFKKDLGNLEYVITLQSHLVNAKMGIVKKLNSVKGLTDTFIKTSNGFKVVNPEGYVAIDRVSGDAVKLVDRMEFSFNNFTAAKAWDK